MSRKDENLDELAGAFYGEVKDEFIRELKQGEDLFVAFPVDGPEREIIENIKARIGDQCRRSRRNHWLVRILQVSAGAASIIIAAMLWYGQGQQATTNTQSYAQVWTGDDSSVLETQVAFISSSDLNYHEVVFDTDSTGLDQDLQTELTELSTSFWEG
ncbi:MAG: hypothetical protein A2Y07_00675 [Planctomycetes bacterium GWF2_50_10]|nr:MAG: hypothetical protein A2Y07_00675 [Planctomycetes bacterium GWF2_50_10]